MFSYRGMSPAPLQSVLTSMQYLTNHGVKVVDGRADVRNVFGIYGNAMVHSARNTALSQMKRDSDFILLIDDDMNPQPEAMARLIEHNAPVAGALCTTRGFPVELALKFYDPESDMFMQADRIPFRKPTTDSYGVGAAFLALRRDAVDQLIEHYLSAQDWALDNERMFERLGVRREKRMAEQARKSALRREEYERTSDELGRGGYIRVFDYPVTDKELQLGEDIGFSRRLLQLGIKVTIDPTIRVGHVGEYSYSLDDYTPQQLSEAEQQRIATEEDDPVAKAMAALVA